MEFLDPKKKRAHTIRLYIGYILMAIALSFGTWILLYEVSGFDVDRKTGEVIQNGLLFVDSHPEQARVLVNGKQEGNTDMRLTLPAGHYNLELQRDGYRTWKRSFDLKGMEVQRLVYPFLFPNDLNPRDVQLYSAVPGFAAQSLDRKWVIIQQPGRLDSFDVVNAGDNNNPVTNLKLPAAALTAADGDHKLELVEWSTDNRHMLVKHTYQGGFEFVMIDREQPNTSFNVNKLFGLPVTEVAMRDKKFDQLHMLDANGGVLRFGDAKSRNVELIGSRIRSFKSYGTDVILYVTEEGAPEGKLLVNVRRGTDIYKIRELPKDGTRYLVDVTRYDDHWYMAAGTDAEHRVYLYKDVFDDVARARPRAPAPISVLRVKQLEFISISANTRFVGVQGGSEFAVYDAEHDRSYRYDTGLKLAPGQKATWMDGHRYTIVSEDKLVVFDYDGINQQRLDDANPGFLPFFDRDYDNLYVLGPSASVQGKPALTRASVRTQADQ